MCSWRGLLTSSEKSVFGRAQPPLSVVLLFSSGSFGPWGMNLLSVYPGEGGGAHLPASRSLEKQGLKISKRLF